MTLRLPHESLPQAQMLLENKRRFLFKKKNSKEVLENTMTLERFQKMLETLGTLKKNLLQMSLKRTQNKKNLQRLQQRSMILLQSKTTLQKS